MGFSATVLGDSHSKYFFNNSITYNRLGLDIESFKIGGEAISAASLAGFRKGKSTLNVKQRVKQEAGAASRLVLAFGQVDLELGFYYRLVVKKESISPEDYVAWLCDIYEKFLIEVQSSQCKIVLKGVNLTVFSTREFKSIYVQRIITEKDKLSATEDSVLSELSELLLNEEQQNRMHGHFNIEIEKMASRFGLGYFDLNADLEDNEHEKRHSYSVLSDDFRPGNFDHHIVDSLTVRRLHHYHMVKAFDRITDL